MSESYPANLAAQHRYDGRKSSLFSLSPFSFCHFPNFTLPASLPFSTALSTPPAMSSQSAPPSPEPASAHPASHHPQDARQIMSTPPGSNSPSSTPSSPLSMLSKSPSLPSSPHDEHDDPVGRYPTPTASSIPSGSQSPRKPAPADREIRVNTSTPPPSQRDGQPPPKKRKIAQPRARTTEYLDLNDPDIDSKSSDSCAQLDRLVKALRKKKKIVVIAGAGISVSAGVPDFRSTSGLFATLKEQHNLKGSGKHLFDAGVYRHDASTHSFHTMVRELAALTRRARPTAFHQLLASLAAEGRLMRLYTQNVDCIDTGLKPLATTVPLNRKGPWPVTIQLHGGLEHMVCTKCGELERFDGDKFTSHEAPLCAACQAQEHVRVVHAQKRSQGVGRMRPRIVLYNEGNPDEDAIGSVSMADLRSRPDAVLVVGTSLKIPGVRRLVKELCGVTRSRRDGLTAWINVDPVPVGAEFRDCWDLVVKGKSDDVAFRAQLPRWDDQEGEKDAELSEEDVRVKEEILRRSSVEVCLPPPAQQDGRASDKRVEHVQGMPTPGASPKLGPKTQSKLSFAKAAPSQPAKKKKQQPNNSRTKLPDRPRPKQAKGKRDAPPSHTVKDAFRTVKAAAPAANTKESGGKPVVVPEKRAHTDYVGDEDSELSELGSSPDVSISEGILPPLRPVSFEVKRESGGW